jgi:hypothetical protein
MGVCKEIRKGKITIRDNRNTMAKSEEFIEKCFFIKPVILLI